MSRTTDCRNFDSFVEILPNDYPEVYPDLVVLASVALVIPVSIAPCERGFSRQNILKSKLRNRLTPDRLDMLLMTKLNGPGKIDFPAAARAVDSLKSRKM